VTSEIDIATAVEIIGDPAHAGPFVFTCEHASRALPAGLEPDLADEPIIADHWGWDPGARDVTLALVDHHGGQAVLSRFSRLVVDCNRDPDDPTFIARERDSHRLGLNARVDVTEHERRRILFFDPYHDAIDRVLSSRIALGPPVHLLAIHSFTPMYMGTPRAMEIGVLFDDYDREAWDLQAELCRAGFEAVLNAPYSGRPPAGLMYSPYRHGRKHGIKYLELEIRQDLIGVPERARAVAARIAPALHTFFPGRSTGAAP
jgi:predicted N-formylglutamate amidohydrolase